MATRRKAGQGSSAFGDVPPPADGMMNARGAGGASEGSNGAPGGALTSAAAAASTAAARAFDEIEANLTDEMDEDSLGGDDDEASPAGSDFDTFYERQRHEVDTAAREPSVDDWRPAPSYEAEAPPPRMPAWAAKELYPTTHRLKVKRLEADGRELDLGYVPAGITEAELLAKWPRAQTLFLIAHDASGVPVPKAVPHRIDFAEDHEYLMGLRKTGFQQGAPNGYAAPAGAGVDAVITLLTQQHKEAMEAARLENERIRREAREERERLAEERRAIEAQKADLQEKSTSLAIMNIDNLRQSHDKLMDGHEVRTTGMFAAMAEQNRIERERAREEAREERERRAHEHLMAMERMREENRMQLEAQRMLFEQQRERDQAWARRQDEQAKLEREREERALRERRDALERQERENNKWMLERDKMRNEHSRALMETQGMGGLDKMVEAVGKLREVKDVLDPGGDEKEDGEGGVIGAAKAAGELWLRNKQIEAEREVALAAAKAGAYTGGGFAGIGGGEDEDDEGGPYNGPPQLPAPPPGYSHMLAPDGQPVAVPDGNVQAAMAQGFKPLPSAGGGQQPTATAGRAPQPAGTVVQLPVTAKPSINDRVKHMKLEDVRSARMAIRAAVGRLKGAPEDQWPSIIEGALMSAPVVIEYLRSVSIMTALLEGGAEELLASNVCWAVDAMAKAAGIPVREG